jgi:NAD(P)-dependent dehydrogenase (short-subunit alcohol dehydrogenase family)
MRLEGKVAIVTGAARGIGQTYAQRLSAEGAAVVVGDIRDTRETVDMVKSAGGKIVGTHHDVTDMASCTAIAELAVNEFGKIDILVNNAALYGDIKTGRFENLSEEQWDKTFAVNTKGVWQCCKAVVGPMRENKGGSIINIATLAFVYGTPYAIDYAASKGAVVGITRVIARELGRDWIRVNAIAPSAVLTEATNQFFGDKAERAKEVVAKSQSLQRNLVPDDLAGTVIWLASEDSKFVTGQTIMVDGGTVFL